MGLTSLPKVGLGQALGPVKSNLRLVFNVLKELSAAEWNPAAKALEEVCAAVGLADGTTPGSLEAARGPRLSEIGAAIVDTDYVMMVDVSDVTEGISGTTRKALFSRIAAYIDPLVSTPSYGSIRRISIVDHFVNLGDATTGFAASSSGGTASTVTPPAGRIGVISFQTGTTTTGRYSMCTGTAAAVFGAGVHRFRADMRIPTASDGTDTYSIKTGFLDSVTGLGTNGAYFRYTHTESGGRWTCVTRANGVETVTDSGVAIDTTNFQALEIDVNATGTQVRFRINGALVATHTTNVPNGTGQPTGVFAANIEKSAGTTNRFGQIDLAAWSFDPTTPL